MNVVLEPAEAQPSAKRRGSVGPPPPWPRLFPASRAVGAAGVADQPPQPLDALLAAWKPGSLAVGAHTAAVLAEAGLSHAEVAAMLDAGTALQVCCAKCYRALRPVQRAIELQATPMDGKKHKL